MVEIGESHEDVPVDEFVIRPSTAVELRPFAEIERIGADAEIRVVAGKLRDHEHAARHRRKAAPDMKALERLKIDLEIGRLPREGRIDDSVAERQADAEIEGHAASLPPEHERYRGARRVVKGSEIELPRVGIEPVPQLGEHADRRRVRDGVAGHRTAYDSGYLDGAIYGPPVDAENPHARDGGVVHVPVGEIAGAGNRRGFSGRRIPSHDDRRTVATNVDRIGRNDGEPHRVERGLRLRIGAGGGYPEQHECEKRSPSNTIHHASFFQHPCRARVTRRVSAIP